MSEDIVVELFDLDITVDLIPTGIPGPPGPSGGYTHTQASAATTWTIPHNLGYRPAVQAFSPGGVQTIGTLTHLDLNTCTLSFVVPVAGTARCA
jgi:hypothetical protein